MAWLDNHVMDAEVQALLERPARDEPVKLAAVCLAEKFRVVHTTPAPRESDDHFQARYRKAKRGRKSELVQREQETEEHWAQRQAEITDVSKDFCVQSSRTHVTPLAIADSFVS